MREFRIEYDRSRYPIQQKREDGTWGCRGCGSAIPKGRQSWCSNKCVELFEPKSVIFAVKQRDKEICCQCGFDYRKADREWLLVLCQKGWHPSCILARELKPASLEYDHIIPFSEGGMTVLENMRTLCSECHKSRTKQWRRERRVINQPMQLTFA